MIYFKSQPIPLIEAGSERELMARILFGTKRIKGLTRALVQIAGVNAKWLKPDEPRNIPSKRLLRIREAPIRVLWYDTEQSAQSTQQILVNRIIPLSEANTDHSDSTDKDSLDSCVPLVASEHSSSACSEKTSVQSVQSVVENLNDQFFVFNVRGIGWEKRCELLTVAIRLSSEK